MQISFPHLKDLKSLISLDLSEVKTRVSEPETLNALKGLPVTALNLDENALDGDSELCLETMPLKSLHYTGFAQCPVVNSHLAKSSLEKITFLDEPDYIVYEDEHDLDPRTLERSLSPFKACVNLKDLTLLDLPNPDDFLKGFAHCPLAALSMTCHGVTDQTLELLKKSQFPLKSLKLNLHNDQVTEAGLKHLKGLPIEKLSGLSTITAKRQKEIISSTPDCAYLN